MVAVVFDDRSAREHMREVGRWWWVPLITGILWLILAWILLSFDATTVWTVAIFTGIFLIFGGATEFMMASVTPKPPAAFSTLTIVKSTRSRPMTDSSF